MSEARRKPHPATAVFALRDRPGRLRAVRLLQEVGVPEPLDLTRVAGEWRIEIERPPVDRMEYRFEVEDHRARRATMTDPGNPLRAAGAFGDKSVREFPEYRPPVWLDEPRIELAEEHFAVPAGELGDPVEVTLCSPASLPDGEPAPLIVVHDGPEFAELAGFTGYLGAGIAVGMLPPVRAALLGPGDRNDWYSANPAYAAALCRDVLPAVTARAPASAVIGVGASLGGLAMLHAHHTHPGTFDGLLLQSASFFTPSLDGQESGFPAFDRIARFTASVAAAAAEAAAASPAVPVVLTCGVVEENLGNNRAMAGHLGALGHRVRLVEVRDAHNYVAWRDALHPHLTELVATVTDGARAA